MLKNFFKKKVKREPIVFVANDEQSHFLAEALDRFQDLREINSGTKNNVARIMFWRRVRSMFPEYNSNTEYKVVRRHEFISVEEIVK